MGIDGNDHEGFQERHIDHAALKEMYRLPYSTAGNSPKGDYTGEKGMGGPTASPKFDRAGGKSAKSAVGGKRKIGKD